MSDASDGYVCLRPTLTGGFWGTTARKNSQLALEGMNELQATKPGPSELCRIP